MCFAFLKKKIGVNIPYATKMPVKAGTMLISGLFLAQISYLLLKNVFHMMNTMKFRKGEPKINRNAKKHIHVRPCMKATLMILFLSSSRVCLYKYLL